MTRSATSTGRRGPAPGSVRFLEPVLRGGDLVEEVPNRPAPRAPSHLATEGKRAWRAVMRHAPLLAQELDLVTVERFARMVDERAALHAELARGYLLEEVIPDPRGGVAGTRTVLNPAVPALRALDKQLDQLTDRLGLAPAARAKLGLTLTTAEKAQADTAAVLAAKFKREDGS